MSDKTSAAAPEPELICARCQVPMVPGKVNATGDS